MQQVTLRKIVTVDKVVTASKIIGFVDEDGTQHAFEGEFKIDDFVIIDAESKVSGLSADEFAAELVA